MSEITHYQVTGVQPRASKSTEGPMPLNPNVIGGAAPIPQPSDEPRGDLENAWVPNRQFKNFQPYVAGVKGKKRGNGEMPEETEFNPDED